MPQQSTSPLSTSPLSLTMLETKLQRTTSNLKIVDLERQLTKMTNKMEQTQEKNDVYLQHVNQI